MTSKENSDAHTYALLNDDEFKSQLERAHGRRTEKRGKRIRIELACKP